MLSEISQLPNSIIVLKGIPMNVIYKLIIDANSPIQLMSVLADKISVLPDKKIVPDAKKDLGEKDEDGIEQNYLHYFRVYHFLEERT